VKTEGAAGKSVGLAEADTDETLADGEPIDTTFDG
jgi:hypothetical protein